MTIVLGDNQYGKAETHVVRVTKGGPFHDIKDVTVSIALAGDFAASHLSGDNSQVVPTDTQKNTVFAFAKESPVTEIEEFGLRLGRHFAREFDSVHRGAEKRIATVTCAREGEWAVGGLADLFVLKSTGSEFWGYPRDRYTTLEETHDRVLATRVQARWRYSDTGADFGRAFAEARRCLIEAFAAKHSLALQQTLYAMGEAVLQARPEIAEIRLAMQNRHHFVVDLKPFGLENENEVFYASDRPYGLIEGTVTRDDAEPADPAW